MGARRYIAVATVAALAALAPVAGAGAGGGPAFSRSEIAARQTLGEPRIYTDPTAAGSRFFVLGNSFSGKIDMWWSSDGMHYRGPASTNQGGGDGDIAIDRNHNVFAIDLFDRAGNPSLPVALWNPSTHRFTLRGHAAPHASELDREWIASPSPNNLTVIAEDANSNELAWVSTDGGRHFSHGAIKIDTNVNIAGPLVTGPPVNGVAPLYFAYLHDTPDKSGAFISSSDLRVAKSTDGGRHWAKHIVAKNQSSILFPVAAADTGGKGVYAAWSGTDPASGIGGVIVFSASNNGGRTWTRPKAVSDTRPDVIGSTPTAVFPWVNAGSPGRVDVTYAIEKQPVLNSLEGSDDGGPQTTWDLRVGQSLKATSSKPSFVTATIAASFHTGSICSLGTGCLGPQAIFGVPNLPTPFDRRNLDYFGAALDGSGRLCVPYTADRPFTSGDPNDVLFADVDLRLGRQTGGATVGAPPRY